MNFKARGAGVENQKALGRILDGVSLGGAHARNQQASGGSCNVKQRRGIRLLGVDANLLGKQGTRKEQKEQRWAQVHGDGFEDKGTICGERWLKEIK